MAAPKHYPSNGDGPWIKVVYVPLILALCEVLPKIWTGG